MRKVIFFVFFLSIISCKKDKTSDGKINTVNDTIFKGTNEQGLPFKTIVYQSKKRDSFELRARYINGVLKDSMYVSKYGFIDGKAYVYIDEQLRKEIEYLNIKSESFLNQFWMISNKDTLDISNYYNVRFLNLLKEENTFQIEIILRASKNKNFDKLFFIYPENGKFSKLNADFSNYNSIVYDTIFNISSYNNNNSYWSKRTVAFDIEGEEGKERYLRGILVERKDTSYVDSHGNKLKYLDRLLFVNKKMHNGNKEINFDKL